MNKLDILKYTSLLLLFFLGFNTNIHAHGSFIEHSEDMIAVFGFKRTTKLFNRSRDTRNNHSWTKFISSDMIDNTSFHKQLEQNHKGFKISGPRSHRLLFHWAYDAEPWTPDLEEHIKEYCYQYDLNEESNIRIFKSEILAEQKRRNKLIINKTQEVFGFSNGSVDRVYSHFFASMAYNIHILGDYMSGNKVLTGIYDFDKLVGQIVTELRRLDNKNSKQLIKGITAINKQNVSTTQKADELMLYLKQNTPQFLQKARGGELKRRLVVGGVEFEGGGLITGIRLLYIPIHFVNPHFDNADTCIKH